MKYILLFIPAIGWGLMPLVIASIKKSTVYNQIVGTVAGAFIFGVILMAIVRPTITWPLFWISALAGALWVVGQVGQYISYEKIGVSETMPISTGLQLIGVPLVGMIFFGEWAKTQQKIWGFLGIIILIIGVVFTSLTDQKTEEGSKKNQVATIILLIVTSLGYISSSSLPQTPIAVQGDSISFFFGQTAGMLVAVFIYTLVTGNTHAWVEKTSLQGGAAGLLYGIAQLAYVFSVKDNGVNISFVMSQLCVVISTLGGIIFLKEAKSRRDLIFTIIGLVLIIAGAVITRIF